MYMHLAILPCAHRADFRVPRDAEHLGSGVFPSFLGRSDDENAGADSAVLAALAGSHVPQTAGAVMAPAQQAVCGAGVFGEADDGVGVASEGHGGHGGGGGAGVDERNVPGGRAGCEEVELG